MEDRRKNAIGTVILFCAVLTFAILMIEAVSFGFDLIKIHYHLPVCR